MRFSGPAPPPAPLASAGPPPSPAPNPAPNPNSNPAPAPAPASASASALAKPAFDIVSVTPAGMAVMAGRAEPGAAITVMQGGKAIGEAKADARGTWVVVPNAPLAAGAAELSLVARNAAGQSVPGDAPVLVVVQQPGAQATPFAVLAPPGAPARILQAPEKPTPGKLGLDTADYDDHGAIRFSGTGPPRAALRLYVDAAPVGEAQADESGHWSLAPSKPLAPGVHRLRLEQLGPDGRVAGRLDLPFVRETLALAQVAPGQVVVQPGQNLWRLARRVYGEGIRYTVIYQANHDQIRDPRRIYAGQVLKVPSRP